LTITNCTITGNQAGGIVGQGNNAIAATDDIFTDNSNSNGGAINSGGPGATLEVVNSTFSGNFTIGQFSYGGAVYATAGSIINSTFYDNTAGNGGAFSGSATITNSILWDDIATNPSSQNNNEFSANSTLAISYSDVDQAGYSGSNDNIDENPDFVSGGLQLQPDSPAINAGENSAVPGGIVTDLAGKNRFIDGVVDMGAYEAQMASIFWTGDAHDQQWNTAANWSDDLVPTGYDDTTIGMGFGTIDVPAGTFAVHSLNASSSLQIDTGALLSFLDNSILTGVLTIQGTGTIDITNGSLAIDYSAAGDSSPLTTIQQYLASGYKGGAWNGTGIISSTAADNAGDSVGYADGSVDTGTPASPGELLIKYTRAGDANLDDTDDFNDLFAVGKHLDTTGNDWANGNFNYATNGAVDFNDLFIIGQNLNKQVFPLAATGEVLGGTIIPLGESAAVVTDAAAATKATSASAAAGNLYTPTGVAPLQPAATDDPADDILEIDTNPDSFLA
jgi:hypothetical protein